RVAAWRGDRHALDGAVAEDREGDRRCLGLAGGRDRPPPHGLQLRLDGELVPRVAEIPFAEGGPSDPALRSVSSGDTGGAGRTGRPARRALLARAGRFLALFRTRSRLRGLMSV